MNVANLDVAALAWTQLWQVTIAALVVGAAARWGCRRRPHLAYLLWMIVVVKALTPPLVASPSSVFSWALRDSGRGAAAAASVPERSRPPLARVERTSDSAQPPLASAPTVESPRSFSLAPTLLAGWLAGFALLLAYAIVKWARLKRRWLAGAVAANPQLERHLREVALRLGVRRLPRVVISRTATAPAVFSVWRTTLLLPQTLLGSVTAAQLESILAHELVHIRRRDPAAAVLQLAAQLVWWFHPLVWWANREARRERERACDEEVVAGLGCRPADYARTLLAVLESQMREPSFAMPGVGMLGVTARRLEHIVRWGDRFHRRTPRTYYVVALLSLSLLLPGAGLQAGADPAPADDGNSVAAPKQDAGGLVPADEPSAPTPKQSPAEPAALARLRELGALVDDRTVNGRRLLQVYFSNSWKGTVADLALLDEIGATAPLSVGFDFRSVSPAGLPQLKRPLPGLILLHLSDQTLEKLTHLPKSDSIVVAESELTLAGWRRFVGLAGDVESLTLAGPAAPQNANAPPLGITDEGLAQIAKVRTVKTLVIGSARITDDGIAQLAHLEKLESLVLGNCPGVRGQGFAELAQLEALRSLRLNDVRVSPQTVVAISRLSHLEFLELSASELQPAQVQPDDVAPLARLSKLRTLHLSRNQMPPDRDFTATAWGDAFLLAVGRLPNLQTLSVTWMGVSETGVAAAANAEKLQFLDLVGVRISDRCLESLSKLQRLRRLMLSGDGPVTDEGLAHLKQLTRLDTLSLHGNDATAITDEGLAHLAGLEALEHVSLSNSQITGSGLAALGRLKKLRSLSLDRSPFGDEGSAHLSKFPQLEHLSLNFTQLTDRGLVGIGKLANLRELYLSRTRITDDGLEHLKNLKKLTNVDVTGTDVSQEGTARLRAALPGAFVGDDFQRPGTGFGTYNSGNLELNDADAPEADEQL